MGELRGLPPKQGLYDPAHEHDSCGVGFVVNIKGDASHDIVDKGIEVLNNLTHRGGCGCDPETGDGAGILMQVPHDFFVKEADRLGFGLPARGEYGVGMVFLPRDAARRKACEQMFDRVVGEEGQRVLGWRTVPHDPMACGRVARQGLPAIRQIFIGRGEPMRGNPADGVEALERKLYVLRKRVTNEAAKLGLGAEMFYVCSLSALTIVYKGQLISHPLAAADEDLADRGKSLAGDASARHRIVRHRAPSEHALSFFTNDALEHLLAGLAPGRVARQEDHSNAVLAARRQSESELVGLLEEKLVRNLHQDSGAIAGVGIASASPPMSQVVEDLDTLVDDVV